MGEHVPKQDINWRDWLCFVGTLISAEVQAVGNRIAEYNVVTFVLDSGSSGYI